MCARYIQQDPLGQEGGVNLYTYTLNPLKEYDLLGLATNCQKKPPKAKKQKQPSQKPKKRSPKQPEAKRVSKIARGLINKIKDFVGIPRKEAYSKGIEIYGKPGFRKKTRQHLDVIKGTQTGKGLIEGIDRSGKKVVIQQTDKGNSISYKNPSDRFVNLDGTKGKGTDSIINYNPNRTKIGSGKEAWHNRPPDVGLQHELKHAYDAAYGRQEKGWIKYKGKLVKRREQQAVGLPPYENEPYTENKYRTERGQPLRTQY